MTEIEGKIALQEQIKEVAKARAELQCVIELKRVAMVKWEEEHADLIGKVITLTKIKDEHETQLREMTLRVYTETGNKKPCEGVAIREVTRLEYDPKEALKWATEHRIALSLDRKSFEGFAKTTPLDFVQIHTEPQATIATELSVEE